MEPDYAAAQACLARIDAAGIDIDALGESLQRHGARAFEVDWAALLENIGAKAAALARGLTGRSLIWADVHHCLPDQLAGEPCGRAASEQGNCGQWHELKD